jgi:hypothetical protein
MVRYMDSSFVDTFFATGELQLSTFSRFRRHPDENMRDLTEGCLVQREEHPNARGSYQLVFQKAAFILCASMATPERLAGNGWKTEHGIRIKHSIGFANAIARQIPGFTDGIEGPCEYREEEVRLVVESECFVGPGEYPGGASAYFAAHQARMWAHMKDEFFFKHARYEHEREYRFVWFSSVSDFEGEPLKVVCPDAIRFCERVRSPGAQVQVMKEH